MSASTFIRERFGFGIVSSRKRKPLCAVARRGATASVGLAFKKAWSSRLTDCTGMPGLVLHKSALATILDSGGLCTIDTVCGGIHMDRRAASTMAIAAVAAKQIAKK